MTSTHKSVPHSSQVITFALPYVNGQLHLGHYYEAVSAWFYHRYTLKYSNSKAQLISGADCHGSATTIYCLDKKLDPHEHCTAQHGALKNLYTVLDIEPTHFGSTNSSYHAEVFSWITQILLDSEKEHSLGEGGEAKNKTNLFFPLQTQVWQSSSQDIFADRFVKGTCSHCGSIGQNPGFCTECSGELDFTTLLGPVNLKGEKLSTKNTTHLGLSVKGFYEYIKSIEESIPEGVRSKILSPANLALTHLDVSRDSPYFGLNVDSEKFFNLQHQHFYVWLDALCGYLSFSFKELCDKGELEFNRASFEKWLPEVEFIHFFGKDISNFHCFLWPNILKLLGVKKVPVLAIHGWVTQKKQKLAKSNGNSTDLSALSLTQKNALRLYYVSNFNGASISDFDFDEAVAVEGYNSLIVKGLANIYARLIKLIDNHDIKPDVYKQLEIAVKERAGDGGNNLNGLEERYKKLFEEKNFKEVINLIRFDVKILNQSIEEQKPWKLTNKFDVLNVIVPSLIKWKSLYSLCQTFNVPALGEDEAVERLEFFHLAQKITDLGLEFSQ